jgi:hypothetical protein
MMGVDATRGSVIDEATHPARRVVALADRPRAAGLQRARLDSVAVLVAVTLD